jgi:hypothetical protein
MALWCIGTMEDCLDAAQTQKLYAAQGNFVYSISRLFIGDISDPKLSYAVQEHPLE